MAYKDNIVNPPFPNYSIDKIYLGDGAFLSTDEYSLWLTTEDGIRVTNKICLEPEVARTLLRTIKATFPSIWSTV